MVTDTTNEILRKNAEMLHQTTVDIATENERGIVDLETLQHTNEELIATLDDIPVSYTHLDVYKRQVYKSKGVSIYSCKLGRENFKTI